MKSVLAGLRNLVLPWGRTTGRRIVLNGDAGTIVQYDDNGEMIINVDDTGIEVLDPAQRSSIKLQPSVSAALVLHPPPIPGSNLFLAAGGAAAFLGPGPDYRPRMDLYSPGVSFGGTATADIRLYGGGMQSTTSAMKLVADEIIVSGPVYAGKSVNAVDHEDWQAAALLNGWTNRGIASGFATTHVRKVASPPNSLQLRANLFQGTTITDGTPIMQLPDGFWPAWKSTWTGGKNSGSGASFEIDADGIIRIYGHTPGNVAQFSAIVPRD